MDIKLRFSFFFLLAFICCNKLLSQSAYKKIESFFILDSIGNEVLESKTISYYNNVDSLVLQEEYDSQGTLMKKTFLIYDTLYNQSSKEVLSIRRNISNYDTISVEVKYIITKKFYSIQYDGYESSNFYNEQGQLLKEIWWNKNLEPNYKICYHYNDEGNIIFIESYSFENDRFQLISKEARAYN